MNKVPYKKVPRIVVLEAYWSNDFSFFYLKFRLSTPSEEWFERVWKSNKKEFFKEFPVDWVKDMILEYPKEYPNDSRKNDISIWNWRKEVEEIIIYFCSQQNDFVRDVLISCLYDKD